MFEILIVLGIALFSFACRSFEHPFVRRLGGLGVLVTTFLIAFFLTGQLTAGALAVLAWFLLPWLEILTRIRRLRLPLDKKLQRKPPPSNHRFPDLAQITEEVENQGFEYVEDTGWDWDGVDQFFRLFYHPGRKEEAAICLSEQGPMAFSYLSISSRTRDGRTWRTWNYPFSYTMKLAPELHMNRFLTAHSFADLLEEHQAFLDRNEVGDREVVEEQPQEISGAIQEEIRSQINHNLNTGLIAVSGNGTFRYSWRGLFFLWTQFVKDMVKLS